MSEHPRIELIALGVQQPWADLIVRGIKTLEVRSYHCKSRGTVYVYASRRVSTLPCALAAAEVHQLDLDALPRGVLVGTVDLVGSQGAKPEDAAAACVTPDVLTGNCCWSLGNPVRFEEPLAVKYLPYGVWFYPFQRKS